MGDVKTGLSVRWVRSYDITVDPEPFHLWQCPYCWLCLTASDEPHVCVPQAHIVVLHSPSPVRWTPVATVQAGGTVDSGGNNGTPAAILEADACPSSLKTS
jgi:hypothetical protein